MAASGQPNYTTDVERLFQPDVPPISSSSAQPPLSGLDSGGYSPRSFAPENTLDEPVWETVKRDLRRIGANLLLVAFPFKSRDQQSAALRNWDLWGPMAFVLVLAICLSVGAPKPSSVFSLVFGVCALGAVVLTVNIVLLGGNIGFFQSMCLLGYCLFPMDIAAIISVIVHNAIVRYVVVAIALGWSSWASVPFIGGSVSPARRALAVYPLLLLYMTMGWLAIVKN